MTSADGRAPAAPRKPHRTPLRWSGLGLVFVGGLLGVAAREGLTHAVPNIDDVPVVVPVVNLLAAFALGYLYEALARTAPGTALTGRLKLLIGTGFCGGLSTYSSLATDTAVLLDHARAGVAATYALGTVLLGALATLSGIVLGTRLHPHEPDEDELRHIEGHAQKSSSAAPGGRS